MFVCDCIIARACQICFHLSHAYVLFMACSRLIAFCFFFICHTPFCVHARDCLHCSCVLHRGLGFVRFVEVLMTSHCVDFLIGFVFGVCVLLRCSTMTILFCIIILHCLTFAIVERCPMVNGVIVVWLIAGLCMPFPLACA